MQPEPGYVVYIDEAGDPGVKERQSIPAWTQWFTLSAVVIAIERDPEVADWVRDMREATRSRQRRDLHYRNLSLPNKRRVCRILAAKHVRLFVVASHKANLRRRRNSVLGSHGAADYYNWCLRLLLERVTSWCHRRSIKDHGEARPLRLIFSERGGHDYAEVREYLRKLDHQSRAGTLKLGARILVPDLISPNRCEVRPHSAMAGLQLADIVASAFFQAANSALPTHELSPARLLKPRIAREGANRLCAGFGLTMLPFPSQGMIPSGDREIFRHYGFSFPKS